MTSAEIKQMRSAEIEEAAEVLSHAMHRNPIHVAVYQGESENERQQIEDAFSDLLRDRPEEVIMAKQGSQIIGVCRSLACRGDRFISPEVQELLDTRYPELSSFHDRHNYWVGIGQAAIRQYYIVILARLVFFRNIKISVLEPN